ncbi:MAG: DoxX family protein [bacterium]
MKTNNVTAWLDKNKDVGLFLLRLFVGVRLLYGVVDNIVDWERMIEFRNFLEQQGFPLPLASAIISVYAQFLSGLMFIIGFKIRLAAALMIVNFLVALMMVHSRDSFEGMTPALAMLFSSILFLFYGAGKFAPKRLNESASA